MKYLREQLTFTQANIQVLEESGPDGLGKHLYLKGICIEGNKENANGRTYPMHEINKAVNTINTQIRDGNSVLGEVDHPEDLKINLDRVCHSVENMWMDGTAGCGKLKILPTPMGELIKTLLTSGVKLGVSSRGFGEQCCAHDPSADRSNHPGAVGGRMSAGYPSYAAMPSA
jgi:hypothetical protein